MNEHKNADLIARVQKKADRYAGELADCRKRLVAGAAEMHWDALDTLANKMAEADGKSGVYAAAIMYLSHESAPSGQEVYLELVSSILSGADDSWSGRGNDVRRAYYDGKRDAVKELRWVLITED